MAGINDIAEELVGVFLAAAAEVLGENPKTVLNLHGRIEGEIDAQRPNYPLLEDAERAVALPVSVRRVAERRMLFAEAEIGERRSVGEALEDAIEVAGIAEVLQP